MPDADDWMSAIDALNLAKRYMAPTTARIAICTRAYAGLIRARARRFVMGTKPPKDNADVPPALWWAKGHEALQQNWPAGDFETWLDHKIPLRAFGVRFSTPDILEMLGLSRLPDPDPPKQAATLPTAEADPAVSAPTAPPAPEKTTAPIGKQPITFWEDAILDIAARIHLGDFKPKNQTEIEEAINVWLQANRRSAAISTVRIRANKIWTKFCIDADK